MAVTLNGTNGLTFNDGSSQATAATGFGFKNRIINGAMVIDQRNAGASVTPTAGGVYTVDRWFVRQNTDGSATVQRSTVAPPGFTNSLLFTVTSADASLGATQFVDISQRIEGLNMADFGWGTANAATVTVSFWVRSSVTGTYVVCPQNAAFNRSYPATFTINSANTWEYKTVTFAGDTSGTWLTDNGVGMFLSFALACGTTYQGTANTWNAAGTISTSSAVNLMATNGATLYITGPQLEKGSTATSFDYRPYGTELALCERYFQRISGFVCGTGTSTTQCGASIPYKTEMRGSPSAGLSAALQITRYAVADFTQSSSSVAIAGGGSRVNTLGISLDFSNFTGLPSDTALPAIVTGGVLTLSAEL